MESKFFLFAVIPLLGVIFIFGYLNIAQGSLGPISSEGTCKNIEYNGEGRIDMLFISTEDEAKHYTDILFNTEPYKGKRNYFNSYVLTGTNPECKYYKGIAILCNTAEVQSLAKQCPHDYIVVVKEDKRNIRSSAYGNVLSINKVHEDSVLIHEMGHAFGNLAEEYGGAKVPSDSKNCVSSCDQFNGPTDSCDLECSEGNYYRSIFAGVMRTLVTSNYGVYDTALLNDLLEKNKPSDSSITGHQIEDSLKCTDPIFKIDISQSDQNSVNVNKIVEEGCVPDNAGAGNLCIGDNCYPNLMFTDSQDLVSQETIEGEVVYPENPISYYIKKDESSNIIDVTLDGQTIKSINSEEVGSTACLA